VVGSKGVNSERIHRAVSTDGTEVAARVQGEGPALVFVNGGGGDGDTSWASLVPLVADRFTCFTLSTRGRGLSADSDDHSCERLVEDIATFADSIGEPVGLVGHSSGASLALAAAAQSSAVAAVAVYEPTVAAAQMDEHSAEQVQSATDRAVEAAEQGRPADAARLFVEGCPFFNDDETSLLAQVGAFDLMAPYAAMWLGEIPEYLRAIDASVIERISVPVLLLHGARTHTHFTDSTRLLAAGLPDSRVVEFADVGHMGPVVASGAVADELVGFFDQLNGRG
jgi:pimeloyl-ACP methyl ester carboxylesterase